MIDGGGFEDPRPGASTSTAELVEQGWLVEVILRFDSRSETVFFAVGEDTASNAEIGVLRYPGIQPTDIRTAKRKLLSTEIAYLKLWCGGARPFRRAGCELRRSPGYEFDGW